MATSSNKKKASAKEHATRHAAAGSRSERPKVPSSEKQRNRSRRQAGGPALSGAAYGSALPRPFARELP